MNRLSKKVAVITGGTSGIGQASAALFTKEGARVVVMARNAPATPPAVETGRFFAGDVTKRADLNRLFADTVRDFGKIDVLMVNAAVVKLAPIEDTSDELFDEIVNVNLKGAFATLRAAIPSLNDGASVILTSSWLNRIGFPGASVVSMTKAAMRSLARVAAAELAPRKIRVNALTPGAIATPLWGKIGLPAEVLEAAGKQVTAQIPMGVWGTADEVAAAALFLASSDSSYVNGSELAVDGGMRQT